MAGGLGCGVQERSRERVRYVQSSMESAIRQMGHMRLSRSHFWRQASWNLDIHVFAVSITFILGMTEIAGS